MTLKAYQILKRQEFWKNSIVAKGHKAPDGFEELVFVTTRNTPISPRDADKIMQDISRNINSLDSNFEPLSPHTLRHTLAVWKDHCGGCNTAIRSNASELIKANRYRD